MKRSQINRILQKGDAFIRSHGFALPPFAYMTPSELRRHEDSAIFKHRLGWDITDYGGGRYEDCGLFLFTVRNGSPDDLRKRAGRLYAEKIMISKQNQRCPMHRHFTKVEDIINRGGGTLVLELYGSGKGGIIDRGGGVTVPVDGIERHIEPGQFLKLTPGESVTLVPTVWHAFWAEDGDCMIGEVSTVNDDIKDNWFEEEIGRFSAIEEDELPLHLLVSDY